MRAELKLSILAGVLSCAALLTGCGKNDGAQAQQAQTTADPARTAAAQRIQERLAAYDAWMKEAYDLASRAKKGEDVKAQQDELKAKMPKFDDLQEDAQKVVDANPADEAGLQAIDVLLRTNHLEFDQATGKFPSSGPAAEQETRLSQLLIKHHANNPKILELTPRLDPLSEQDYLQQVYDSSRNATVRANFAALLALHYFAEMNKPKLSDEQRAAFRDQGMRFVETIRTEYPTVVPSQGVSVPKYLRPAGQPTSNASEGMPTLVKVMEDRVRLLDQSVGNTLPNLESSTVAGKKDALENYRGKVVLVDVWATWCGPCKAALPELAKLKEEFKGQPFEIIGLNADDDEATLKAFLKDQKLPWVHWYAGSESPLLQTLGIVGYPTYLVVDARGVLRERTHNLNDDSKASIRDLVEKASRI